MALTLELMVLRALLAWPFLASDSPGLCRAPTEREVVVKEQKRKKKKKGGGFLALGGPGSMLGDFYTLTHLIPQCLPYAVDTVTPFHR